MRMDREKIIKEIEQIIENNNKWHEYDTIEDMAEAIYNAVIFNLIVFILRIFLS